MWSLCPVQLGNVAVDNPTARNRHVRERGGNDRLGKRQASTSLSMLQPSGHRHTTTPLPTLVSISTTLTLGTATGSTAPTASAPPGAGTLIQVGPYSCTTTVDLQLLTGIISGHLGSTQFNTNATLKFLVLNLHAAAPASDPTGSGAAPANPDLLSNILNSQVSDYLYTPSDLARERADLNATGSWFGGLRTYQSNPAYYDITQTGDVYSTPDGWPGESFVELSLAKRLFTSYGRVDPQLSGYNFSGDASTIFGANYLQKMPPVTIDSNGQVGSGCFFDPGVYSVSRVNDSWATAVTTLDPANSQSISLHVGNLTNCGISPLLNQTLNGQTADENPELYIQYARSTIWSWGPGEPHNATDGQGFQAHDYRCAVLNATSGFWTTENCGRSYRSACRRPDAVYEWSISNAPAQYMNAQITCPAGTDFDAPRTALENTYLLHTLQQTLAQTGLTGVNDELLWVNFNDLDIPQCWVTGVNATCPYVNKHSGSQEIIVPTIAAVVVFVLAFLTILVKCAANRQQSKRRRRRGDDGWDYEGVPS